jgi:hypothetical protein
VRHAARQHTSAYVSIRQHTSAYVPSEFLVIFTVTGFAAYVSIRQHGSIHQHTSAYVSNHQHTSAYVSIRQNMRHAALEARLRQTSAYASIRQHTSAYVSIEAQQLRHTKSSCMNLVLVYSQFRIRQHTSAYVSIRQQLRHMKLMHEPRISVFAVSHHYKHTLMSLHAKSITTAFKLNPKKYF